MWLHKHAEKTKLMKLFNIEISLNVLETLPYEKVEKFQYISVFNTKNDWPCKIETKIIKAK